jgi:hypothetical protein
MVTVARLLPKQVKDAGISEILNNQFKMISRLFNRAQLPCHLKLYGRSGKTPNAMQFSPRNEVVKRSGESGAWGNLV